MGSRRGNSVLAQKKITQESHGRISDTALPQKNQRLGRIETFHHRSIHGRLNQRCSYARVGRLRGIGLEKTKGINMNKIIRIGLALLILASASVTNARAEDPIAAWNQISETAVKTAGHPPPVAALDFAIVHLAIYDAVESIERRYAPYYTLAPGAIGSPSAAAAKAGHDVLVG